MTGVTLNGVLAGVAVALAAEFVVILIMAMISIWRGR